ncbi:MAG: hypothetical protein ACRDJ5_12015 [Actinomycetota bacterium]
MIGRTAVVVVVAASALVPGHPAGASCVTAPPLKRAVARARTAFVGRVLATSNEGRWATVDVLELWRGDPVPEQVHIQAGPADPILPFIGVASSTDRHFRVGARYLFFPYGRKGRVFQDNNCTSTTRFGPRVRRLRPAGAVAMSRDPVTGGLQGDGLLAGAAAAVILAGVAWTLVVIRRRRRAPSAVRR